MEEEYWEKFMASGRVMDYLYYKGLKVCGRVMRQYDRTAEEIQKTGEQTFEPDNSYGNGTYDHSCGRI